MGVSTTAACTRRRASYLGDDALSSVQARELAALLVAAADEIDRWAAR
jgi:hypothetical protein